jgi:serine protease 16
MVPSFTAIVILTLCLWCIFVTRTGAAHDNSRFDHEDDNDVQELYITQKLDHFDSTNVATFQQRYFASYRYHNSHTGPIISLLCVGGEGPGFEKSVLIDSVHCSGDMLELAKRISKTEQKNVHLYALEHRYYGLSYPKFEDQYGNETSPLTIQNLRFLSSRQALEDLAHFVSTINQETTTETMTMMQKILTPTDTDTTTTTTTSSDSGGSMNTWVSFGGSYPGLMAMYFRYKYPHLIAAAVSSSAPLRLKVDFEGYKSKQGWDLKYDKVGGSMECHRIVKEGHVQAVALLKQTNTTVPNSTIDGPVVLANKFNICQPDTALRKKRNQDLALGDGLINIPSQGNDPSCTENEICNIAGLCKFMVREYKSMNTKSSNNNEEKYDPPVTNIELEVLAKVAQKQYNQEQRRNNQLNEMQLQLQTQMLTRDKFEQSKLNQDDDDCTNVDYDAYIEFFASEEIKPGGSRSWLYQTCAEFGFYQTCLDDCPFASHYHEIDFDIEFCSHIFNITNVYDNVQASLDYYGGKEFINTDASNILTINGNVDPWSVLGLEEDDSTNYKLPVKMVTGASHHAWTHAVKDTDALEIIQIREYIYSCVMDWLGIGSSTRVTGKDIRANNGIKIENQNLRSHSVSS